MRGDDWFTLAELTERLGGLVWVEEQLAELLSSWASVEASASVAVVLATASSHHRWHAEVVRGCLPTSPRLREVEVVCAPTAGWENAIATLSALTEVNATLPRLKALVKVIDPWIEREIGALRELSRPISDAAMMRWLRFVSLDHDDDGAATASLLTSQASAAVWVNDHRVVASLDLGQP
jgi:hypothetical protein